MRRFSHRFTLPGRPEIHIDRFTARGEEAWVPGWRPTYIDPPEGTPRAEQLWTTASGADLTYWCCLAWDPVTLHARYLRLTPNRRASFVDVRLAAAGDDTEVAVSYDHHPLTDAAAEALAAETDIAFAEEIEDWRRLILAAD